MSKKKKKKDNTLWACTKSNGDGGDGIDSGWWGCEIDFALEKRRDRFSISIGREKFRLFDDVCFSCHRLRLIFNLRVSQLLDIAMSVDSFQPVNTNGRVTTSMVYANTTVCKFNRYRMGNTKMISSVRFVFSYVSRIHSSPPHPISIVTYNYHNAINRVFNFVFNYLSLPVYTVLHVTYLRNIDKIGYAISIRIEKRTNCERNQENKKYKISYIYYVDLCNTQLLLSSSLQSYSIVISKRNWVISSRLNRNRINNKKRYNKTVYRVTKL